MVSVRKKKIYTKDFGKYTYSQEVKERKKTLKYASLFTLLCLSYYKMPIKYKHPHQYIYFYTQKIFYMTPKIF